MQVQAPRCADGNGEQAAGRAGHQHRDEPDGMVAAWHEHQPDGGDEPGPELEEREQAVHGDAALAGVGGP